MSKRRDEMITGVIDGSFLLHRCMHVKGLLELETKAGIKTGGMVGFANSCNKYISDLGLNNCIVVFDGGISKRRRKLYPEYKGDTRREKSDPLYVEPDEEKRKYRESYDFQVPLIERLCKSLGIKFVKINGLEADDVIYNICKRFCKGLVYTISDDQDYYQMICETETLSCRVFRPMLNEIVHVAAFERQMGYPFEQFLLRKAIIGDRSDSIVGVEGAGETSANTIMTGVGSIGDYPFTEFFNRCARHKGKRINKIATQKDVALRNYQLVDISREIIPDDILKEIEIIITTKNSVVLQEVNTIIEQYEVNSVLEQLPSWIVPFQKLR
jgi:DNA polymerase I